MENGRQGRRDGRKGSPTQPRPRAIEDPAERGGDVDVGEDSGEGLDDPRDSHGVPRADGYVEVSGGRERRRSVAICESVCGEASAV